MNFSAVAYNLGLLFTASICIPVAADTSHLRDDVMVLMYETDEALQHDRKSPLYFFQQKGKIANIQTTVFGANLAYHGFGDKYQTLKPLLEVMDPNKLVILADARDVILNVPDNEAFASLAIDNFLDTYRKLTADAPNAIVMSAEAQCCVSAMAHAHPGAYFDPITKERKSRACASGQSDCLWYPGQNIDDWQTFMEDLAFDTTGEDLADAYLNAGLMAGYPADLINILNVLNIDPSEDDQAVLSGLMYQFPDMIKLDYRQEMFGNGQWTRGLADGCVFETQGEHLSLIHTQTGTEPLILHTPGKFYDCLDVLIEDLGGVSQQRYLLGVEQMERVATNNGFTVTSDPSRRSPSGSQHRKLFFGRVQQMVAKIREMMMGSHPETVASPTTATELAEETSDNIIDGRMEANYGNYGNYDNYGQYGNYGNYDNYGVSNYGVSNYGSYNIESTDGVITARTSTTENYGNYGVSNYGQYGNYGVSNYGVSNYGNYGNYGNDGDNRRLRRRRRRNLLRKSMP